MPGAAQAVRLVPAGLARAGPAGLTGFTDGGELTTQYLMKRQGRRHFEGFTRAGTGIIQDVEIEIGGVTFAGTDHVLRLKAPGLRDGRVEQYRREAHALRLSWRSARFEDYRDGPVSLREDGASPVSWE